MLTTIHITVRDRVPTITAGEDVISHNSDYVAEFEFDEEWQDKVKTVYFVCEDGSYQAVVMSGNSCGVPMLDGEHRRIFVGVQAGAAEKPSVLKTTRPCCLKVKDSIADYLGEQIPDPTPSVYEQIIAMLESITSPTWDAMQNKPFSTLGSGLSVDENGVLSAEGGGSANAVQYVAQTLTDEQKTQARTNIGASPIPTVRYWLDLKADNIINLYNMGVGYGIISPVDYDQTVPTGMSSPMLVIFGRMNYGRVDITVYDGAGAVWRGSLNLSSQTTDVTKTGDYVTNTALTDILQNYVPAENYEENLQEIAQAIGTKLDKNQGTGNAGKILGIGEDGIVVPQDKPSGGTVTVDSELSSTSENPVQNKVVTAALAEKITAPTTAAVGQIIKVKSVDTSGKPTEWEAADLPSGGEIELVSNVTTTEEVNMITYSPPAGYWATDYVIDVTTPVYANGSAKATYYIRPDRAQGGMECKNALRQTEQFAVSAYLISKNIGNNFVYIIGLSKGRDIYQLALPYGRFTQAIQVYTASDTVLFPVGTSVKIYAKLVTEAEKNANLQ